MHVRIHLHELILNVSAPHVAWTLCSLSVYSIVSVCVRAFCLKLYIYMFRCHRFERAKWAWCEQASHILWLCLLLYTTEHEPKKNRCEKGKKPATPTTPTTKHCGTEQTLLLHFAKIQNNVDPHERFMSILWVYSVHMCDVWGVCVVR